MIKYLKEGKILNYGKQCIIWKGIVKELGYKMGPQKKVDLLR